MIHVPRAALSFAGVAAGLLLSQSATAADPTPAKPKSAEASASDPSQPSRAQCLDAHRNAQELKQAGKLLEAQEHLAICSSGSCPGVVIADCGNWLADLEQSTPSMVFELRLDGKEATLANVFVDDKPVADRTHAVKVNPGRHTVRVELPPFEPHEEDVVLPEGQRMRLISVQFTSKPKETASAPAEATPPPKQRVRPTPVLVYPLAVLGVAGLGSFGAFAFLGKSEQTKLEDGCAPRCTNGELSPMKRWYTIGDISAGVGAAALVGAAIVYLARPTHEVESESAHVTLGVGPVGLRGATASSVGLTASRTW
jgi:hypothetical protein